MNHIAETSRLAFQEIQPQLGARQRDVYEVIKRHGPVTNKEIKEILGWDINSVTPRCLELRNKKLVTEGGRKTQRNGRTAESWKVASGQLF